LGVDGIIYCYRYKNTGHFYVGQTLYPEKRQYEHAHVPSSRKFGRAIQKHGIESFVYEVLMENVPEEELGDWESFFIWQLQSFVDVNKRGFNLTDGGDGGRRSEETRVKMAAAAQERAADPEWRAKNAEQWRKIQSAPGWKEETAERSRHVSTTPKWKASHAEGMKKRSGNQDWLRNTTEANRRKTSTPEWRAKNADAVKKLHSNPLVAENEIKGSEK
jgi:group I intron endonuclease